MTGARKLMLPTVQAFSESRTLSYVRVHWLVLAALVTFFAGVTLFLFADLGRFPLVLWDESRLAVSALEMSVRGLSLVTTYNFAPDLWSTKPPLQIWFMAITLRIFSNPEFALRIPSALSALGTVALTLAFTWRVTRSPLSGLFAGFLLVTSRGFYGTHVARTGDYDSLLVFFSTAYLFLLFFLIHRVRSRRLTFMLVGLCVACAVLTKSIAGLLPGIGIPVYLTLVRRWPRITSTRCLLGILLAVLPITAFYLTREAVAPGYLKAALVNDFGRYGTDIGTLDSSPFYYIKMITGFTAWQPDGYRAFSLGPLLVLLPIGWFFTKLRVRLAMIYIITVVSAFMLVISLSKTRLFWYDAPAIPWLAVASALAIHAGLEFMKRHDTLLPFGISRMALSGVVLGTVILGTYAVFDRHYRLIHRTDYQERLYGQLFGKLLNDGFRSITIIDHGFDGRGNVRRGYDPLLAFYKLLYESRDGLSIRVVREWQENAATDQVFATCSTGTNLAKIANSRTVAKQSGCSAVVVEGTSR